MFSFKKIYIPLLLMIFISMAGFTQQKEMEMAQSEYNDLQFNNAADYYLKAISKMKQDSPDRQYSTFMLAECYRMMNDPDMAEPYYKELTGGNFSDTHPVLFLRYASVLKTRGDISGAIVYFKKYLEKEPSSQEAKTGLKSCEWILANENKSAQINVSDVKPVNSSEDDFAPAFLSSSFDQLIFTTNRVGDKIKSRDQWTGSTFSDLYKSSFSNGAWGAPAAVEYFGLLNSEIHEGTPSLNGDFSTMYFTRCDRMAETRSFCQIWKTERSDNKWMTPKLVMSDSTTNVGQPSISKDELTLLFSSDMKGSNGGKDIWIARRESKDLEFGKPVPLGPEVNTPGDELFPYLYNDTTLYFSSNGYEGYGGWDIYKSEKRKNSWSKPENLKSPFNSGYDDFGIIIQKPDEEGYFTSNRPGGQGGDDIYHFTLKILLFSVSGQLKDNMNLLSIKGAQVLLVGQGMDTTVTFTDKQGYYKFDTSLVMEDQAYELIFKKDNYFAEKEFFSTVPYEDNHDFIIDVKLNPIPEQPIVLPDILYALDKWDLAPQYQDSLMQLVDLLHNNETLVIELRSHTDSRGSYEYNDILSQKRAQSVVDFLVSQEVDPDRLVAKGYGERIARVLDNDMVRENYKFKKGTELNDMFINGLPSKEVKEAAFQLNRRTEFAVLAKDYKPGSGIAGSKHPVIQLVSDSTGNEINYTVTSEGKMKVTAYLNDYSADALIDQGAEESVIDERIVLDLLKKGAIDRLDFQGAFEEIMVDDHIAENAVVTIRKIRLGENVISDSKVKVKKDAGQYLILGKDLLDKAGSYIIDEVNRQLIFK